MRFFEQFERHFRLADAPDVRFAIDYCAWRNSTGQTRSKDGSVRLGASMPKSIYWHPFLAKGPNTNHMTPEERADYNTAFGKVFKKLDHDTKHRGLITI